MKSVSSLLYYLLIDILKGETFRNQFNQEHLHEEQRIKPRKEGSIIAFNEEIKNDHEEDELMIGLYSKESIMKFINDNELM